MSNIIFTHKQRLTSLLFMLALVLVPMSTTSALTSSNGDFEAETFTSHSGNVAAGSQTVASGRKTVRFYGNSWISKTTTTPSVTKIAVTARGQLCNGAPQMVVNIDGKSVMTTSVPSTNYSALSTAVSLGAGSHTVKISFTNDYYISSGCDRNLLVDKVEFTPGATTSPAPTGERIPPTVQLISPVNGTVVKGQVDAYANASDASGIKKVEFYLHDNSSSTNPKTLIRTQNFPPYCFAGDANNVCNKWDTSQLKDGNYTITAIATDNSGNSASATSTVTVSNNVVVQPPTTNTGAKPVDDSSASGAKAMAFYSNMRGKKTVTTPNATAISITAKGDLCNGAPNMVVKLGGTVVLNTTVAATTYQVYTANTTIAAGTHEIAIEYGNDAQTNTCDRNLYIDKIEFTAAQNNTDTTPPTASFTDPKDGSTVGATIAPQVAASDSSGVKQVSISLNGGQAVNVSTAPYCLVVGTGSTCGTIDTRTLPNGTNTITAVVTDNSSSSNAVTIKSTFTVNNTTSQPPSGTGLQAMLQYDMACANGVNPGCPAGSTTVSEVMPNNFNADWANHPKNRSTMAWQTGSLDCHGKTSTGATTNVPCVNIEPWGVLYQQQGGNKTKASVQISDLQSWAQYSDGAWYKLTSVKGVPAGTSGNIFPETWLCPGVTSSTIQPGSCSRTGTTTKLADGSTSAYLPQCAILSNNSTFCGYLYHFWSAKHFNFTTAGYPSASKLTRVVTLFRARIDPASYDANAKYVMAAGMDRYGANWENGWEQSVGRFKKVDANWRVYSTSAGSSMATATSLPGPLDGIPSGDTSEFR